MSKPRKIFDSNFATSVSNLCYEKFQQLPKSGKPVPGKEWTFLAAIVKADHTDKLSVISLATGTKCVGRSKLSEHGDVINDSHAEVLARRGFIRYLYEQIRLCKENETGGGHWAECIFKRDEFQGRYRLADEVTFHLFTSHMPCGDASIFPKTLGGEKISDDSDVGHRVAEKRKSAAGDVATSTRKKPKLLFSAQDEEEEEEEELVVSDIHRTGAKCLSNETRQDEKLPGVKYHATGAVRTKPGRGDPTLSVSCSDKILRWNVVGIQGALLTLLLVHPLYLSSVIVGNHSDLYSLEAMKRALIKRSGGVAQFCINPPALLHSEVEFTFGKRYAGASPLRPTPCSILWCDIEGRNHQVYVEGRRLGCTRRSERNVRTGIGTDLLVAKKTFLTIFKSLTENKYEHWNYLEIKSEALEYQKKWQRMKKFIGGWSEKDSNLLRFC